MRFVALLSLSMFVSSSALGQDAAGDAEPSNEPTAEQPPTSESSTTPEDAPAEAAPAEAAPAEAAPAEAAPAEAAPAEAAPAEAQPVDALAAEAAPAEAAPTESPDAPLVGPLAIPSTGITEAPAARSKPERSRDHEGPGVVVDVGYKAGWSGMTYAPIRRGASSVPHFVQAGVGALFDNDLQISAQIDLNVNPARGKVPFVASLRVGFAEFVLGRPTERGPFTVMQGYSHTYVGIRWVHDYELGGGEWSLATADASAIEVGYTRAAPFGDFTVISDSQFAMYIFGWKHWCPSGCNKLPLTLLDQRLSIGYDPVYLDFRFRQDPVLGQDLSAGVSMRTIF